MVPQSKASIGFTCRPHTSLGASEAGNRNHDVPRRAGDNTPSPARLGDCNRPVKFSVGGASSFWLRPTKNLKWELAYCQKNAYKLLTIDFR
jgi:hypothetical protein